MTSAAAPMVAHPTTSRSVTGREAVPAKVDNVQHLRALAAFMVVSGHVILNLRKSLGLDLPLPLPGTFGVEVFFVISGFIITYTSEDRFARPGVVLSFLNHRFWRVVPLYWIMTTVYLTISLIAPKLIFNGGTSVAHTLASYAFLPWPNAAGTLDPLYAAGWSLNYEVFFYLLFGLVLWLPLRLGLSLVMTALVVLACLNPVAPRNTALEVWSRPFVLEFLTGVVLAVARRRLGARLGFVVFWPATALLVLASVVAFHTGWATASPQPLTIVLAGLIAAVAVFCRDAARRGPVLRLFTALGDSSYSLYLVHMFAVRFVVKALEAAHLLHRLPWGVSWGLSVGGALLLGWVSYRGLELGFIPAVRRRVEGRRPSPAVSPA